MYLRLLYYIVVRLASMSASIAPTTAPHRKRFKHFRDPSKAPSPSPSPSPRSEGN